MIRTEQNVLLSQANVTSNINSESMDISTMDGFSVHASYVDNGSFAGTIKIQASIDGTNFVDVADSSSAISVSNGNFWNYNGAYYRYFRVSITVSAGDGDVFILAHSKGIS
jgi:hypothetical protein